MYGRETKTNFLATVSRNVLVGLGLGVCEWGGLGERSCEGGGGKRRFKVDVRMHVKN